jgi:hypothetical protein
VEKFGQFDAHQFTADDDDPVAQRHPSMRRLADEIKIAVAPVAAPTLVANRVNRPVLRFRSSELSPNIILRMSSPE